jgi:uncharacterized membrane protein
VPGRDGSIARHPWRRLLRSAFLRPTAGLLAGPLLVALALAIDAQTTIAERGSLMVATGNARPFLGSILAGSFTVAAMVFWVRGMLVQLAAGGLPARVLRPHMDDAFLRNSLALILATFGYGAVLLLRLPADPAQPAPFVAMSGAFLLGTAALMAVVVTIVNSVQTTDESNLLSSLTHEAVAAVRRRYPEVGASRQDDPASDDDQQHTIGAPASGWVDDIDADRLMPALPAGCHLRVYARSGSFVAEGSTLATYCGGGGGEVVQAVRAAVTIGSRRDPIADVEYAVGRLMDVAMDQLGSDAAGRTGGHEALMHLALVLSELAARGEQDHVVRDGDRSIEWVSRLSREDLVEEVFSPLHQSGKITPTVAVTLLRGLGLAKRSVRDGDPLGPFLEREARRILDALPDGWSEDRPVSPVRIAREEELVTAAPARPRAAHRR